MRRRLHPWVAGALGGTLAFAGAGFLVVGGIEWADRIAYLHARACDGGTSARCLRVVRAGVVDRERQWRARGPDEHWLTFRVGERDLRTDVPARGVAWAELEVGDTATVTLWHGQVVRVTTAGRTDETDDSPVRTSLAFPALGVLLAAVGDDLMYEARRGETASFWAAPGRLAAVRAVEIGALVTVAQTVYLDAVSVRAVVATFLLVGLGAYVVARGVGATSAAA